MCFPSVRAVFVNLKTVVRKYRKRTDTENVKISEFARELWEYHSQRFSEKYSITSE